MGFARNLWRGTKVVVGLPVVGVSGFALWDIIEAKKFASPQRTPKARHENSVLVCGAGIVGVSTAYFLARDGYAVTVLDARPQAGEGASNCAAGLFLMSEKILMLQPGYVKDFLVLTVKNFFGVGDGTHIPLRIKPDALADPYLYRWGVRALRTIFTPSIRQNSARVFRDEDHFFINSTMNICKEEGIEAPIYGPFFKVKHIPDGADSVKELGPFDHVEGQRPTWHKLDDGNRYLGECGKFVRALADVCAQKYNVKFVYDAQIEAIEMDGTFESVSGVRLKNRRRYCGYDQVVIAMGAASVPLLRAIDVEVPVYAARGYALTVDGVPKELQPSQEAINWPGYMPSSVFNSETGRMRWTTFAEFSKPTLAPHEVPKTEYCVESLKQLASWLMVDEAKKEDANAKKLLTSIKEADVNVGERPWSSDDLPNVSTTRYHNLFINCGHGHWGWRLGCGSSLLLVDIMSGKQRSPSDLPNLFRLDRHRLIRARFNF